MAARAGYTTAVYEYDRDGVDIRIQAGGAMRPAIELQLKSTTNLGPTKEDGYFYWLNLLGCAETENQSSVTVLIPAQNVFDVDSLHSLMEQSRGGKIQ